MLCNLLHNDPSILGQHILINDKAVDDCLLKDLHWNEERYGTQRRLKDMIEVLVGISISIFVNERELD